MRNADACTRGLTAADDRVRAGIGPVPPGWRAVERYVILPSARHPQILAPASAPGPAAAAVTQFSNGAPARARLAAAAAATALRTGIAQRVLHRPADPRLRCGADRNRRQELGGRLVLRRLVLGVRHRAHRHQDRDQKHDPLPASDHAEVVAQRNRLIPSCFHRWILSGRLRSSRGGPVGIARFLRAPRVRRRRSWEKLPSRPTLWPPTPMVPPSV